MYSDPMVIAAVTVPREGERVGGNEFVFRRESIFEEIGTTGTRRDGGGKDDER